MAETLFTDIINNLGKSKVKVTGSGSKTGKQQIVGAPSGITSDKETINLQGSAEIPITNNVDFLLDGQYNKFRDNIEYKDDQIFLEDAPSNINRKVGIGFNKDGEGFGGYAKYDIDKEKPEFFLGYKKTFADGGSTNGSAEKAFSAKVNELMDDGYDFGEAVKEAMRQGYAKGGRINFDSGGSPLQKLKQEIVESMRPYAPGVPENKLQIIVKDITFDMSPEEAQASAVSNFQKLFGMANGGRVGYEKGGIVIQLGLQEEIKKLYKDGDSAIKIAQKLKSKYPKYANKISQYVIGNYLRKVKPTLGLPNNRTNLTEDVFVELRKQNSSLTNKQFADYLNDETDYFPNNKEKKYSGDLISKKFDSAKAKGKFAKKFKYAGSTVDKAVTPKEILEYKKYAKATYKNQPERLKKILALNNDGLKQKVLDQRGYGKKIKKPGFKEAKNLRNKKYRKEITEGKRGESRLLNYKETIAEYNRARRADSAQFFRNTSDPKSLLWEDLLKRNESNKDKFFKYDKSFKKKKNYTKAETQSIVLKDKNGNKYRYNTLLDDIDKAGYDARKAFKPYDQKSFLYKSGLMPELNKIYGVKLGSRQNPFHIHHVQGASKNPFNVMLTFATENLDEGKKRVSLNAAFNRILEEEKLNPDGPKQYTAKKNAINQFKNDMKTNKNIAYQIGKVEEGNRPRLIDMLKKSKVPLTKTQKSGAMSLGSFPAQLGEIDSTGFLSKIKNNITDVDYSKMQLGKGNVAKVAGIAKNAAKVAGKALGVAALPLEAYFMKQMYNEGKTPAEILASPFFLSNMVGEAQDLLKMEPVERQAIKNEQIAEDFSMMDSDFYTPPLKGVEAVNTQMVKDRVAQERALEEEKRKNLRNKTLPNEGLLRILSNPTYEGVL